MGLKCIDGDDKMEDVLKTPCSELGLLYVYKRGALWWQGISLQKLQPYFLWRNRWLKRISESAPHTIRVKIEIALRCDVGVVMFFFIIWTVVCPKSTLFWNVKAHNELGKDTKYETSKSLFYGVMAILKKCGHNQPPTLGLKSC